MNRIAARFNRLSRAVRSESGFTLVAVIGITLALGAGVTSAVAYTSTNSRSAYVHKSDQLALALAEAGVNNALAAISNPANDPMDPNLLPSTSRDYEGGTATWSGTLDRASASWTVTATGAVTNPTGGAGRPIQRTVTMNVPVDPARSQTPTPRLWDYMVATKTGTACDETLSSTVTNASPLYVFGNLCVSSGARVTGGPLAVKGNLTLTATDSSVGSTSSYIDAAHIAGTCKYNNQAAHAPCTTADHVYAATITQSPPPLTVPNPDWNAWYDHAMPGPKQSCTASSGTPPVFDNNAVRDRSVTSAFNLTPLTSYSCRVGRADDPMGELTWDAGSRVLTVKGTIFIDGSAKVDNAQVNTYVGRGTLYLSGVFNVLGNSKLCAVSAGAECDFDPSHWNLDQKLFTVVANGNGGNGVFTGNSVQIGCYDRFQGALFSTFAVAFASGSVHQGPIVASTISIPSSMTTHPFRGPTSVAAGTPGSGVVFSTARAPDTYSD